MPNIRDFTWTTRARLCRQLADYLLSDPPADDGPYRHRRSLNEPPGASGAAGLLQVLATPAEAPLLRQLIFHPTALSSGFDGSHFTRVDLVYARQNMVSALGRLGAVLTKAELQTICQDDLDLHRAFWTGFTTPELQETETLVRLASEFRHPANRPVILQRLLTRTPGERAVTILATSDTDWLVNWYLRHWRSNDRAVLDTQGVVGEVLNQRIEALQAKRREKSPPWVEPQAPEADALAKAAETWEDRYYALRALYKQWNPNCLSYVRAWRQAESPVVRIMSAGLLARHANQPDLSEVVAAAEDPDIVLRAEAIRVLGQVDAPRFAALFARVVLESEPDYTYDGDCAIMEAISALSLLRRSRWVRTALIHAYLRGPGTEEEAWIDGALRRGGLCAPGDYPLPCSDAAYFTALKHRRDEGQKSEA